MNELTRQYSDTILGVLSVKLYDRQGSVLRAETTLHDADGIKVFRPKEGEPEGPPLGSPRPLPAADQPAPHGRIDPCPRSKDLSVSNQRMGT